jgi:gamma-glutamylcyclotransferase (GGCT)/AIG2-like uncharacterized protein YtfP
MTESKFFVYGSLTEGLVHFNRIRDFVVNKVDATLTGSVYRLKVGYPVFVEQGQDTVIGQLLTIRTSDLLFNLLDAFHGVLPDNPAKSLYFRKFVNVNLKNESGTSASDLIEQAWVYILNPLKLPVDAVQIKDGDWQSDLRATPCLPEKLSDRQKNYVLKLGASSGREIVPIDLGLYRELMNLELIVDKGRRLALSKLGLDVYKYLS